MQVDSTVVTGAGEAVGAIGTVLIGAGAAAATGLLKHVAGSVSDATAGADKAVHNLFKPVLPAVVLGLSMAIPVLANAIGLTDIPSAEIVATAPVSTVAGIALREALRRWIIPLVSR